MTSAINPNNIDGTYPVAGQDNNSQGFRDNFTNIKTNFQYAEDEITDLQTNAVVKNADNDLNGSGLSNAVLNDMGYKRLTLGTTGGSVTINYADGIYQTMTTNATTQLAFTNFPPAGVAGEVYFQITVASVAHTLTLPVAVSVGLTGVQGISGQVITFGATGTYNFRFTTNDGGTTVTVYDLNRPLNYYTNALTVAATTSSTSTTTGALVVGGGAGIAGNLNVGGSGIIAGDLTVTGNLVATGNIAGDKIFNGTTSIEIQTSGGNANISVGGVSNVALFTTTGAAITGTLSGTGNVSGANLNTVGQVVAAGNVSGSNLIITGVEVRSGSEDLASSAAANLSLATSYFTTGGAETATLAAGTAGQIKTFAAVDVSLGDMVVTVTNPAWGGAGTITFGNTGDACTLQYIDSKWFCIGNNGCVFA
jgi:hypothetical protein